ncbi:DUF2141 domain-containing protein [Nostoc sp. FACHB-87]|uniref:DUF2141 domain-containing protein n=1 Tax=Nostocales TaxID=1161 RepID=UPI0016887E40|nr:MULTISPECIES: DUF2141 domain-containing protein [Nostocales]MBD2297015.1 DUF2141 domain-containing protein [Nostoc sp. FACHB-190]MBD2454996.1 DUF2141 domain-containing protein [Nostoc sp. FACHB-87]MBD2474683.1 DUF2141 domain-containing protein [Anabaena sp. FACHB-83]MBD2488027.1 DUF2141 domain-containing protein [Aulosira sp. FACHB-615]
MSKKLKVSLVVLAALGNLALPLMARASFNGNLTVEIDGLKNTEGQVCASIFASSQGFPSDRDRVLERQCTKITEKSVTITFSNLKAGNYAVAVMHDENNDFTVNRSDIGFPLEGFGFSQNPEIRNRAPKFDEAAVLVAGANTDIKIYLKYL